jgi:hypothetical protein
MLNSKGHYSKIKDANSIHFLRVVILGHKVILGKPSNYCTLSSWGGFL